MIPPFQAPDEFNHIKRAYLLGNGSFILGSKSNISGGPIDVGLLKYMSNNIFDKININKDIRVTKETIDSSNQYNWEGIKDFSPLPNTAMYFPLSYLPHGLPPEKWSSLKYGY